MIVVRSVGNMGGCGYHSVPDGMSYDEAFVSGEELVDFDGDDEIAEIEWFRDFAETNEVTAVYLDEDEKMVYTVEEFLASCDAIMFRLKPCHHSDEHVDLGTKPDWFTMDDPPKCNKCGMDLVPVRDGWRHPFGGEDGTYTPPKGGGHGFCYLMGSSLEPPLFYLDDDRVDHEIRLSRASEGGWDVMVTLPRGYRPWTKVGHTDGYQDALKAARDFHGDMTSTHCHEAYRMYVIQDVGRDIDLRKLEPLDEHGEMMEVYVFESCVGSALDWDAAPDGSSVTLFDPGSGQPCGMVFPGTMYDTWRWLLGPMLNAKED